MSRATVYLAISAAIWLAEGFMFSHLLQFSVWQEVVMAVMYSVLFCAALLMLRRVISSAHTAPGEIAVWRYLSLAPMLVLILGSFISLPIVLAIAALGAVI